jgi:hypothetical protein
MSNCRSAQIEGFAICIYIWQATGRQRAARQRAVWCASLATGRQDDSATTCRLTVTIKVVLSLSTTQRAKCSKLDTIQISHHSNGNKVPYNKIIPIKDNQQFFSVLTAKNGHLYQLDNNACLARSLKHFFMVHV